MWRGYSSVLQLTHPADIMYLLVVGCVRWPVVVFEALALRNGFEPRAASAGDWHDYLQRLVMFANGKPWKDMFDIISPGRSRVVFGLCWLCKHLGVICKAGGGGGNAVRLGVSQTYYSLTDPDVSRVRIQAVMDGIASCAFRFPESLASSQDIINFCDSASAVVDQLVGADSSLARGYGCLIFSSSCSDCGVLSYGMSST